MNIETTTLGYFRIATVSPKIYVGDVKKNVEVHIKEIKRILEKDPEVHLIVFPELSLTGYTCGDLFLSDQLKQDVEEGLSGLQIFLDDQLSLLNGRENLSIILGAPSYEGGKIYNSAYHLAQNQKSLKINKENLPGYQEFYEYRWFTPGENDPEDRVFEISGVRVGVEICEDLWVPNPPCEKLVTEYGADVIINLSASPRLSGKFEYLKDLVKITSGRLICGYVYVSSGPWESSTDLVFSRWSMIYENAKQLCISSPAHSLIIEESPDILITDIDIHELRAARRKNRMSFKYPELKTKYDDSLPEIINNQYRVYGKHPFVDGQDYCEVFSIQSLGLQRRIMSCGGEKCKVIVGVSGGTDSTLALLVAADAMDNLGYPRKNIIGVTMPCFGTTQRTKENSWKLMELLEIDGREICIKESVTAHLNELGHPLDVFDIAYENAQARMRTQVLFNLSNMEKGIVLGTGDMSELALGWCTFGGDHLSSYNPNVSVSKTLVKALLGWYGFRERENEIGKIIVDILKTPVSPELLPPDENGEITQISENTVGPYELHDYFLYHTIRSGMSNDKILKTCFSAFLGKYTYHEIKSWFSVFLSRFNSQQFKRNCLPDGPKTGSISLSPRGDWRMPSDL